MAQEHGHDLIVPTHHACEIEDIEDVCMNFASGFKPDAIINCTGKLPGASPQSMLQVNAIGPWNLATQGIRIVHMSTDCVFSGEEIIDNSFQPMLRASTHSPDPVDIYGRSKLAGEVSLEYVLNVRGSFIDPQSGFLRWILNSRGKVRAWTRASWNGTSARRMAELLVTLAEGERVGVVHAAAPDSVTKAWMIEYLADVLDLRFSIELVSEPLIWRALEPGDDELTFPPVKEMLDELVAEIKAGQK